MSDLLRRPATQPGAADPSEPGPACMVVTVEQGGAVTFEAVDSSFEQVYRIVETFTMPLFLALCRSRGLLPYRRSRQHAGTVCVRATVAQHDALWVSFLELSGQLQARLAEVACAFVHAHVARAPR